MATCAPRPCGWNNAKSTSLMVSRAPNPPSHLQLLWACSYLSKRVLVLICRWNWSHVLKQGRHLCVCMRTEQTFPQGKKITSSRPNSRHGKGIRCLSSWWRMNKSFKLRPHETMDARRIVSETLIAPYIVVHIPTFSRLNRSGPNRPEPNI